MGIDVANGRRNQRQTIVWHLLFWAVFLLLWSTHDLNYHRDFLANLQTNIFAFLPYALLVYFNLYYLAPNFLLQKKIGSYLLLLVPCIGLMTWVSSKYLYFYFTYVNVYVPTANFFNSFEGRIAIVTEIILALGLSMTLFLIDEWYRKERILGEIEQKRLEMELTLLRNQVNPHFLFNTLNSIYVSLGRSLREGKELLVRFSDLLSYQLYETGKKRVSLHKEFENLINYMDIERVRHEDLVTVSYGFPKKCGNWVISPMLLLPLIENAFKHGQSSQGYEVLVKADVTSHGRFMFYVENTVALESRKPTLSPKTGIGLNNVRRRLTLIYPNRHSLTVGQRDSTFIVQLEIELDEDEVLSGGR